MHVHLPGYRITGEPADPRFRDDLAAMLEAGRRAGINKQVILGLASDNQPLRELVDMFPHEVVGFMRGMCTEPKSLATLEKYVKGYGFKGVKLHEEPDWPLTGLLACGRLLRRAGELNAPVVIHSWHSEEGLSEEARRNISEEQTFSVRVMAELGSRYPDTTFIFAHLGGMWVKAFQATKPYPNLCFDTSGFDPERGIVEKAVEVLGPERVFFGSDAPGRNYAAQLAKVRYADISEGDKRLIMGENASQLLDLR